jgi:NhaA family Na+:H+ antiporter
MSGMGGLWKRVEEYSVLLLLGAAIALVWGNLDPQGYHAVIEAPLWTGGPVGALQATPEGPLRVMTLHYLVNDVLMALFFALAGKEVWEATALKRGALRGPKAFTPLIATAGGMLGPVTVYLIGAALIGQLGELGRGWAIPTATDIAFSYLVGRIVFGAGHPAVTFLLMLAIVDDAAGLVILAIFYPTGPLAPAWLLVSLGAAVAVWALANRLPRARGTGACRLADRLGPLPYVLAGAVSWYAFQQAGVHPALGLLPIIPAIPHADVDFGLFADGEEDRPDLLSRMEHALKPGVQVVLFLFGLANAGVEFSAMGPATWLVLAGLVIGKPLGIFLFGWIAARPMGLGLPEGMRLPDLFVLGCVAAIGFTVSLFVAGVAFDYGPVQSAARMGALLSFGAAILAVIAGRLLKVERRA